jgi:hypothetical protein
MYRTMIMLSTGMMLLQFGGCMFSLLDLINTALLGVTAAGSVFLITEIN